VSSSIVLIGPADALPAMRENLDSGAEMYTFTDAEALEALEHVIRTKPRIIALEHDFSGTKRGAALINRIKDDPALVECEVRVIAHDPALNRVAQRAGSGSKVAVAVAEPNKPPLDQRGTRRAPRVRVREGVEVLIDGNSATLVDLSTVGAQVLSTKMLKPNQRVRMTFTDNKGTIRCNGSIAWASFEMPKGEAARYRAGIEITAPDPILLGGFAERHKK
jgi:hypothetical protein